MNLQEQSGIRISLAGAIVFAILGFSFAVITGSQAVLLDGVFNLISAVMVLLAMRITKLIDTPFSRRLPAGYTALEPLYVLIKGLILLVVAVLVVISNIIIMLNGGNALDLGIIIIYIGVVIAGNLFVYFSILRKSKAAASPVLDAEIGGWKINTLISSGIGVAFLLVFLFQDGALKSLIPYADQVVVIIVGLVSLPVPLAGIRAGARELLLMGTGESQQEKAESIIRDKINTEEISNWKVFVLKSGRKFWISLFVHPAKDLIPSDMPDKLRNSLDDSLVREFPVNTLEVIVTKDLPAS